MTTDMQQSIEMAKDELKDWMREHGDDIENIYDFLSELVDETIPVYNHDRVEWLLEDLSLAYVEDAGVLDMHNLNVFDVLAASISEMLSREFDEYFQELKDELVECEWCGNQFFPDERHSDDCFWTPTAPKQFENLFTDDDTILILSQRFCSWKCLEANEDNMNSHLGDEG